MHAEDQNAAHTENDAQVGIIRPQLCQARALPRGSRYRAQGAGTGALQSPPRRFAATGHGRDDADVVAVLQRRAEPVQEAHVLAAAAAAGKPAPRTKLPAV